MIYESQCKRCGTFHEYSRTVAEMHDTPKCCGRKTTKVINTAPMAGAMSWGREKAFYGTDGTYFDSGHKFKKWMKDNNKVPLEEGKQEAAKVRKRRKDNFDKKLSDTVVESYDKLTNK